MNQPLRPARLRPSDLFLLGGAGLRSRPLRVVLSALGIAIGVAAMTAIVGISVSSKAEVNRRLDQLGTNLLLVSPGQTLQGQRSQLPVEATSMVGRIGPVHEVAATGKVNAHVYRNDHMPVGRTGSITVLATDDRLLATVAATVRRGSWLNAATARYPAVVLGATAAQRLDVYTPGMRLWLGGAWFSLVGVLEPVPLAAEMDSAALIGWETAQTYLGFDGRPTTIYLRAAEQHLPAVRSVLGATANPQHPDEVLISRPSDAIAARASTNATLTQLLVGLGAVALLVGGVGIGNTMVISVLERRQEIGLRRALGATRRQIRAQFVTESLLLSGLGGACGTVLGTAITAGYAIAQGWPTVMPWWASPAALAATILIGVIAGLYPAVSASRLAPTQALSTP
ncbi:MAG: ABC transporter permease [Micromonosporaceae bacterium]|nr:ABC transporter permease [Micromonosporaceae bacterium]